MCIMLLLQQNLYPMYHNIKTTLNVVYVNQIIYQEDYAIVQIIRKIKKKIIIYRDTLFI